MKILVTGGAGYIGSFTVDALKKAGFTPVVFDSLETGHLQAIPETSFYQGNLQKDIDLLEKIFEKEKPEGVIHFAAYIEVGESVLNPEKYFYNNVLGTLNLLRVMIKYGVLKIVFSSTAAVYGEPEVVPIDEDSPKNPTNPYGESKLMVEKILKWYAGAYKLSSVALRYFNAAGASLDGNFGQDYPKPTHLITRACLAALGKIPEFQIFGDDYPTPDGTCIRDYIHVLDLADAHVKALNFLKKAPVDFYYFNVGTGKGFSVKEVVEMVKKVSGVDFPSPVGSRRPGDPAQLIAKAEKIKKTLNWEPKYSDLKTIVETAWKWHKTHPEGY
ncbi:MAG: UDP-glucose 4-epimerase GalE [Microgenomates group bacterium]